ncbi:hypothetical protein BDZ97DRAFT_1806252 [Flammula alnicola]|nr:hypothetical protein BDZ97DRAFT_1806252 [Flammula alnicola]
MQGIMVHRICSMHFGNMMIYRILVLSLVIEFVLVLVIQCLVGLVLMKEDVPNPVPGYSLCTTPPYTAWMATFWIPIVFFESLVLYLAIRVGLRYRAHIRYSQTVVSTRQSLAYIMCRDSILFPFMSLIMCIIGFISNTRFSPLDIEMAMSVSGSVLCIIGPRLILNLREAYYQPFTEEMKMEVESDKAVVDLPP